MNSDASKAGVKSYFFNKRGKETKNDSEGITIQKMLPESAATFSLL